jgi:hypothetical protein
MIPCIWIPISTEAASDLECHSDILTWVSVCHSVIPITVMAMVIPIMVILIMVILIMDTVTVVIHIIRVTAMAMAAAITTMAATCTIPTTDRYTMDLAGQLNPTARLRPALRWLQTHDA